MMEYKGYVAKVEFDDEANLFHGQVLNMRDVITFQGQSVDELRKEFAESVEDYLEFCAERGEEPEKPFSGRFVVRVEPSLHREIAIAASRANRSINSWISQKLEQAVRTQREPSPPHIIAHPQHVQHVLAGIVSTTGALFQTVEGSEWGLRPRPPEFTHPENLVRKSIKPDEELEELYETIKQGHLDVS